MMANPQSENGHTDIAHDYLENLARACLSGSQYQIMLAVIRKTWGWKKTEDSISYGQLSEMTGLHRQTIIREIKELVAERLLVVVKRLPVLRLKIQKDYDQWLVAERLPANKRVLVAERLPTSSREATSLVAEKLPVLVAEKLPTKEKKETIKETIQKKGETPAEITRKIFNSVLEKDDNYCLLVRAISQKYKSPPENVRSILENFTSYWTEPNKSGTKQRWEMEKTFEVKRRLITWISKEKNFNKKSTVGRNYDE